MTLNAMISNISDLPSSCLCHRQEGSWAGTKDSRGRTSYPVRGSSTLLLSGVLQRYNVLDISKLVHLYTQIYIVLMSYVWCREGNYIYQKSKNVYKYPPFKLEAKTIQNDQESWFRTLILGHDCTMCNYCLAVQIFSSRSKDHLKNNQDQGSLASSSPSQGVIFRSIGFSDESKGNRIGKKDGLYWNYHWFQYMHCQQPSSL